LIGVVSDDRCCDCGFNTLWCSLALKLMTIIVVGVVSIVVGAVVVNSSERQAAFLYRSCLLS
jgi:hypothetical protein